ncbi:hypothetical protein AMELA_G00222650 [Ameiurus melas]|uniref:Sec16 central conserved domain-containing protein n=1 Tax=Ameiurus melas TaxID=219545 RepID=A0A7J5ZZ70_AMEME|nr:hypothetical protein AMELA_G00222650 [Ameiurus melas]
MELLKVCDIFRPPDTGELHRAAPCRKWNYNFGAHGDNNMADGTNITFPGPLLSPKMKKDNLMAFIQKKSEEILLRVDEPEQMEAYIFWQIMKLLCSCDGLVCGENQYNWCRHLTRLLCSSATDDEQRQAVIKMADDLGKDKLRSDNVVLL